MTTTFDIAVGSRTAMGPRPTRVDRCIDCDHVVYFGDVRSAHIPQALCVECFIARTERDPAFLSAIGITAEGFAQLREALTRKN